MPLSIQEHRGHPGWCPRCQKMYEAPLPPGISRGGLVGPTLTTLIAYRKGPCHASFSTVRKFLRDVVGVTIARGELARIIAKVSQVLERPHQELLADLADQDHLNVDETGHKRNGARMWTWCFRASLYTFWKGLKSIGLATSCSLRDGKETVEVRYYISSLEVDVERFARSVRSHWGIENGCHWSLDMTFREDESRLRERHLRENFAWLNRFALSLLK